MGKLCYMQFEYCSRLQSHLQCNWLQCSLRQHKQQSNHKHLCIEFVCSQFLCIQKLRIQIGKYFNKMVLPMLVHMELNCNLYYCQCSLQQYSLRKHNLSQIHRKKCIFLYYRIYLGKFRIYCRKYYSFWGRYSITLVFLLPFKLLRLSQLYQMMVQSQQNLLVQSSQQYLQVGLNWLHLLVQSSQQQSLQVTYCQLRQLVQSSQLYLRVACCQFY